MGRQQRLATNLFNEDTILLWDENLDEAWKKVAHITDFLSIHAMNTANAVKITLVLDNIDGLFTFCSSVFLLGSSRNHVKHP